MRTKLWLALLATLLFASPSWARLGSASDPWCPDNFFLVEETLSVPDDTQMTLSIMAAENLEVYVEYATTLNALEQSGVDTIPPVVPSFGFPQTALEGVRSDFIIPNLMPNTRYYYRLRCRNGVAPADDWLKRPTLSFKTLPAPGTTTRWKFASAADSHIITSWSNEAACGTVHEPETNRWNSTLRSMLRSQNEYAFYATLGDEVMTHCSGCQDCTINAGTDDELNTGGSHATLAAHTNSRYRKWLNLNWQLKYLPLVYALGNHDLENNSWTGAGHTANNATLARASRLSYLENPVDIHGNSRAFEPEAMYYDFVAGDAHFWVIDPFINSTSGSGTLNPQLAEHWLLGGEDQDETVIDTQWEWLKDGIENSTSKFNFVLSHHLVGGSSAASAYWYGRGGIRATTSQTGMTGVCAHDAGEVCTSTSTCTALQADSYCTNGFGGDPLDDFAGRQADIQGWLETAAQGTCSADSTGGTAGNACSKDAPCTNGWCQDSGAGVFLYGHDHFVAMAEKFSSSGGSNVHYVVAGKPAGDDRTGWGDQPRNISQYDFDQGNQGTAGLDITDGATSAVYDSEQPCWETGQCGTMDRGYFEVEFFNDESIGFRYVVATDEQHGVDGSYLTHLAYGIDKSVSYQRRDACKGQWLYDQAQADGVDFDDDCPATGVQLGDQAMTLVDNECATAYLSDGITPDLPGTYGPAGTDPRYACTFEVGDGYEAPDTTDQMFFSGTGATVCTWMKPDGTSTQNQQNIITKGGAVWLFRYMSDTNQLRMRMNATNYDTVDEDVITPDEWNHVCASWAGNTDQTIRMYVNGLEVDCELEGGGTCAGTANTPGGQTVRLAHSPSTDLDFEGALHEVQIYGEPLEPEQVCRVARCGAYDEYEDMQYACDMPAGQVCSFEPKQPYPGPTNFFWPYGVTFDKTQGTSTQGADIQ